MSMKSKKGFRFYLWLTVAALAVMYFLVPQEVSNPVEGATASSFNHKTFWHPWGDHHHRGVDIFAKKGTPIHPAVPGIVVSTMSAERGHDGGNCLVIAGTRGRLYYYAHLQEICTHVGAIVGRNDVIGKVGDTGNAKGKPAHCHFSIPTLVPQFGHMPEELGHLSFEDDSWQKIFFVNPVEELSGNSTYLSNR